MAYLSMLASLLNSQNLPHCNMMHMSGLQDNVALMIKIIFLFLLVMCCGVLTSSGDKGSNGAL